MHYLLPKKAEVRMIRALGYIGFEASNLGAWKTYASDIVGLQIGEQLEDGTLVLRADEYQKRIFIHPGDSNDIAYCGWETTNKAALEYFCEHVRSKGIEIKTASRELTKLRGVVEMAYFHDPEGLRHEIYFGAVVTNHKPFVSPLGNPPFLTGEQGIGHIVIGSQNYEQQSNFFEVIMGFKITDFNDLKIVGLPFEGHLTFFRCNPRHHSLALGNFMLGKGKFNHLMLEVSSLEEVGLAYERAKKAGVHILMDIGQHTNDKVLSFYMLTPSGWAIEVGWGAISINEETWHVTHHPEPSIWGHTFHLPNHK
ncbi:VOC family protein [Pseudomonas syringae group genomosp. 3]|uniref:VOC family protein n=1 Tax=Pseudomonas syringae group genomosp. 3 TaxID=251701 RepID=UPI0011C44C86|nr:VOC family protein [Pseudomonas syringae group genomosp. 3]